MSYIHTFAKASAIAYKDNAKSDFRNLGYNVLQFVDYEGAQCYLLESSKHYLLAFRGTEPGELSDIKADLNAIQRDSKAGKGDVHSGFAKEVDKVFQNLEMPTREEMGDKPLYVTGHSLGAAMATIACHRLQHEPGLMAGKLQNPYKIAGLYTYGSPRAGDKAFVKSLDVEHFRCRNNNDLVTKVPFWLMGYRHHGKLVYINYYGNVRRLTPWQRFKDGWRGRFRAWSKFQFFDGAYDHSINEYERKLTNVVLSD
tara:strand:- start:1633 stop:2397 length:765 start_codon:yes stop_codon:yes gene_type:complete